MNTQKQLDGQVAVVTGGGRGIGLSISRELARLGAAIVLCGRSPATLERAAAELREARASCEAVPCDVTDLHSVEALGAHVDRTFGRIDILVNNAGIGVPSGPLHDLPPSQWDPVFNTNLRGVYYCVRAFAPMMIRARAGHIVNISSIASKNALRNGAAYAASKWGLNGLSFSLAEELREYGVRVSVVCPGSTASDFSAAEGKHRDKMLSPDDVAHAVAMLVTQASRSFVSEIVIRPTQKP